MFPQDTQLAPLEKKLKSRGLRILQRLGEGTFSNVYQVVDRKGHHYALKVLLPSPEELHLRPKARHRMEDELFANEKDVHSIVSQHPNVLTCHEAFTVDGCHCLLLDFLSGGTLLELASETPRFWRKDSEIKRVFTQLIDAVAYCHARGVAHRDLKPENILVDEGGDQYFIADFGLSTTWTEDIVSDAGSRPYKSPDSCPESRNDMYDTQSADIWALGIILINIVCGFMPWRIASHSESDYDEFTSDPYWLQTYLPLSSEAIALLARVLEPEPTKRISLSELRQEVANVSHFLMDDAELAFATDSARAKMAKHARQVGAAFSLPHHPRVSSDTPSDGAGFVPSLSSSCASAPSFELPSPPRVPSCSPISSERRFASRGKPSIVSRMLVKLHLRTSS